ncbi:LacI family DNA-binding transcriptional regulator [Pseudophaeobacter flagellatus]|uniref:LacI family DNA-binding transcriptional regulator n=1 Tax=Pseudophaeobacter flagellatus TaxID=2899119 RepID=UPI0022B67F81|nr:LacI family DNA-binding transcriptional regulator [Pseudophaeobacter flagellatus]MCD9149711.1 LacI family DNA-binding transcriptional regulator [Pseudophaeobacter flagellatus]
MHKRKTLQDVALAAGVSKMTASRALRGDKDVSQRSIMRVQKAAREIGYVGNHLASSLAGKATDLIGVVLPNLENIVFSHVLNGITETLYGTGLQPVCGITEYDPEREYEVVRNMLSWRPTGLIVTGLEFPADTAKLLREAHIPVVQIMDTDGDPIGGCVGFSHHQVGFDMAQALVQSGRKRIGYIGCGLGQDNRAQKRFDGFLAGLQQADVRLVAQRQDPGFSSIETGRHLTRALWQDHPDLDCIYYSNDDLAAGGYHHFNDLQIAIPDQVGLVGCNGLDFISGVPGRIGTTRTPRHEIGEAAVRMILQAVASGAPLAPIKQELRPEIDLGLIATQPPATPDP